MNNIQTPLTDFVVIHLGLIVCRGRYQALQLLLCFDSRSDNKGDCFFIEFQQCKKIIFLLDVFINLWGLEGRNPEMQINSSKLFELWMITILLEHRFFIISSAISVKACLKLPTVTNYANLLSRRG